jgi:hypothetical protein
MCVEPESCLVQRAPCEIASQETSTGVLSARIQRESESTNRLERESVLMTDMPVMVADLTEDVITKSVLKSLSLLEPVSAVLLDTLSNWRALDLERC